MERRRELSIILLILVSIVSISLSNYIDGECVDEADLSSATDYFPDKVEAKYSTLFSVEYFNSYKVVSCLSAGTKYYLYQCGTEIPTDIEDGAIAISVPVTSIALGDTTFIPRIEQIGERLAIKAYTGATDYISSPCINQLLDEGLIVEAYIENGNCYSEVDNLALADAEVAVTFALDPYTCSYNTTSDPIFNVVIVDDLHEESSLAIAEWIKYFSVFFNKEAEANLVFQGIDDRYTCTSQNAATCAAVIASPNVSWSPIWLSDYGWGNNKADTYYDIAISAAGGNLILCASGSFSSSYGLEYMTNEEFLACNQNADVCIFAFDISTAYSDPDVKAMLDQLNCFTNGQVFDNQRNGPYDWFESRYGNPDVLLEDLIMTIHDENTLYGIGYHDRVWLRNHIDNEVSAYDGICADVSVATGSLANECIDVVITECSAEVNSECTDEPCAANTNDSLKALLFSLLAIFLVFGANM